MSVGFAKALAVGQPDGRSAPPPRGHKSGRDAKEQRSALSKPNAYSQFGVPKPFIDRRFPGLV
jgi:hypothetical protein